MVKNNNLSSWIMFVCCAVMVASVSTADDTPTSSAVEPYAFTTPLPKLPSVASTDNYSSNEGAEDSGIGTSSPSVTASMLNKQSDTTSVPVLPTLQSGETIAMPGENRETAQSLDQMAQPFELRSMILSMDNEPEESEAPKITEAVYQVDDYYELGMDKHWVGIESEQLNLCAIYSHPTAGSVMLDGQILPLKRGERTAFLAWWDGENIGYQAGEMSFIMGRELAKGAHAEHRMVIDGQVEIYLVGISNRLYVHPDNDLEALSLMSKGGELVVYGAGKDGEVMRDSYSLMGVQASTQMVAENCQVYKRLHSTDSLSTVSDDQITSMLEAEFAKP